MSWTYCELVFSVDSGLSSRAAGAFGKKDIDFVARLSAYDLHYSYFRLRSSQKSRWIQVKLLSTPFKDVLRAVVGKSIFFVEGVALQYYHPISLAYDPTEPEGRRVLIKNQFDLPTEIGSNYELRPHEQVHGEGAPGMCGVLCAIVDKEDYAAMTKLFFLEKLGPTIEFLSLRSSGAESRKREQRRKATPLAPMLLAGSYEVVMKCRACGYETRERTKGLQFCPACRNLLWPRPVARDQQRH